MGALIPCLWAGRAVGQENPPIDEIVVSAQKRTENVQKVPIAVTVIDADTLEKSNVSEFADVAKLAPSMNITVGDQPGNSAIIIRGIGTFAFSVAVEPSVLVVVDDVPVAFQAQAFTDLVDLERIEVLSGPQSTLFGKSASAGVVTVTTKAPTRTFTDFGEVKATDDGEQRYALSVSGPISDTVTYRLSGAARSYDGNVDNLASGYKIDDDHSAAVRGKIRWQADDRADVTLAAHYIEDHAHCCAIPLSRLDPGARLFGIPALTESVFAAGITPSPNNSAVRLSQVPVADVSEAQLSSHAAYDFGSVTLLSVSAFTRYTERDLTDYDNADVDTLQFVTPYINPEPPGSLPPSTTTRLHGDLLQGGHFDVKTFCQEFRLTSDGHHEFNYLLGAYHSIDNLTRDFARGFVANALAVTNYIGDTHYDNDALFAQTDWRVLPRTTAFAGLRVNRELSSYTFDNFYKVIYLPAAGAPTSNVDTVPTGKVGLQYQFTEDLMAFAFAARGYKGVAYDLTSGTTLREAAGFPVKAEKSDDYEFGLRSEWLHRLLLNATVYNTEYTDFQVQTVSTSLMGAAILSNIPKVRTRGLELEGIAQISPNLHARVGYAYTDARALSYPMGQCYSGEVGPETCMGSPAFQNLAGAALPNAPKNKVTVGLDYIEPIPGAALDADLNLSSVWQSAINFVINNDPGTVQPPYGITNLSLTLRSRSSHRLSVAVFCNNLFDKHYAVNMNNVTRNYTFPDPAEYAYNQEVPRDFDRYFGLRVGFASL